MASESRAFRLANRRLAWPGLVLFLLAAPLFFRHGAGLTILSQMGIAIVFGLSFNILLGQGGMLSFGHAVYSGLGAYVAIHALNLAGAGVLPVPVALIPLVGGLAGMGFGMLFGYVTTKKSGTAFAMITLGMVELVFASALMFPGFFGGEGGITTNRVIGAPVLGISFGPQIEVYYLVAFWLIVSSAAMHGLTRTPLGRMLNAVRDNSERAEFIGYNAQRVRYLALVFSAFFAGIAGGLAVVNVEIVTAENVSAMRSAGVLLSTYIGGIGYFIGPAIGAVVGVLMSTVLPEYTRAWQLYFGLLFIAMVLFAPRGLAGMFASLATFMACAGWRRRLPSLAAGIVAALMALAGAALVIEMLYFRALESADGTRMHWLGVTVETGNPAPWLAGAMLIAAGATVVVLVRRRFGRTASVPSANAAAQGDAS